MTKAKKIIITLIPLAAGGLSSLISGDKAMDGFNMPPLSPPDWLFPIVWSVLYLMIGLASMLYLSKGKEPYDKLGYFYFGLLLNFSWPILFFRLDLFWACVAVLAVMIIVSIISAIGFYKEYKPSGYLMVPYILWLLFALYLNIGVAVLN